MRNGHAGSEPSSSIWQYIAERGGEPTSSETLALDADRLKVEAILKTGALDAYPVDERIAIGWAILHRQRGEVH
jgi:hypothetical protein